MLMPTTGYKLVPVLTLPYGTVTYYYQVDCDKETALSSRYHVSKYPTIKYIQVRAGKNHFWSNF
jgi:hypothetical protein